MTTNMLTLFALLFTTVSAGCSTAPLFVQRRPDSIPESQEIALGSQAYRQLLAQEPETQNKQLAEMVNRVGQRIAAAADKPKYDWEFRVIAKNERNAFALPGGKVAVYEGIIPVCQDEAGLAVVMSHEIAHTLARHGGERLSQQAAVSNAGKNRFVLNLRDQNREATTADRIKRGYGVGSHEGTTLPYARKHESEADAIGLILMAKAGYDPSAAPEFWERFSKQSGSKSAGLLANHPADARRTAELRAMLPEAMNYYKAAPQQLGLGNALPQLPKAETLAGSSADSQLAALPTLTPLPGAPQKATMGPPPPLPKKVTSTAEVEAIAANTSTPPRQDSFRLPVALGQLSPLMKDSHQRPDDWDQPTDDGWHRATGQTMIP